MEKFHHKWKNFRQKLIKIENIGLENLFKMKYRKSEAVFKKKNRKM